MNNNKKPFVLFLTFVSCMMFVVDTTNIDGASAGVETGRSRINSKNVLNANGKLNISVYYETQCHDSQEFINNQISRAYRLFPEIVIFNLIPFGKAFVKIILNKYIYI